MAENVDVKINMVDGISKALNDINQKLGNTNEKVNAVNSSLMNMSNALNFAKSAFDVISSAFSKVVEIGGKAESTQVAFATLVRDEQKAADVLKELNEYANKTPFSNLQLADTAKTLLNFGIEAENVNGMLRNLGDIAMGDANKLNSLAVVMGQVSSAGKMQGQDLMQFINAGFNPLKELADMTGISYENLQNAMSKGAVKFSDVQKAIEHATGAGGQFEGMADKLSQTFEGKLSTAIGTAEQSLVDVFKEIKPTLMKVMDFAMDLISPLQNIILKCIKFGSVIADWYPLIVALAGPVAIYSAGVKVATTVTNGWAVAQAAINAVMAMNPIGLVVAAIAALSATIVICWNKFDKFRAVVKTTWSVIKDFGTLIKEYVTNRIAEAVKGIGTMGQAIYKLFSGDFKGAFNDAKSGYAQLVGVGSAKTAINAASDIVNGIGARYNSILAGERANVGSADAETSGVGGVVAQLSKSDITRLANAGGASKASAKTKSSANAIAQGGTRNTSITFNFNKEMVKMDFVGSITENAQDMEKRMGEMMLRVLASAKAAI